MTARRPLAALAALLAALALSACGEDTDPLADDTDLEPPALTIPDENVPDGDTATTTTDDEDETDTTTTTTPDAGTSQPTQSGAQTGGQQAPSQQAPQDSPQNDTPPPADSPAQKFEQFCAENPGAC